MPPRVQRFIALLASATLVSGCAASAGETPPPVETVASEGACAAPTLEAAAVGGAIQPGDAIELTVENLTARCADTPATSSETPGPNLDVPVEEFQVIWLQNDGRMVLDAVEPNDGRPFSFDVSVPRDALPGRASILIGSAELGLLIEG